MVLGRSDKEVLAGLDLFGQPIEPAVDDQHPDRSSPASSVRTCSSFTTITTAARNGSARSARELDKRSSRYRGARRSGPGFRASAAESPRRAVLSSPRSRLESTWRGGCLSRWCSERRHRMARGGVRPLTGARRSWKDPVASSVRRNGCADARVGPRRVSLRGVHHTRQGRGTTSAAGAGVRS